MAPTKPLTLSNGREVVIDLNKITIVEFREMIKQEQSDEDEYRLMSKLTGIDVREVGYGDYRRIVAAFFDAVKAPVDPT